MISFQTNLTYTLDRIINTVLHILMFIVVEDTIWFIFSPFYTVEKYTKEKIWWDFNQPWIFGLSSDIYKVVFSILLLSYLTSIIQLFLSLLLCISYIPVTIYLAPYYHKYYIEIHN